MRQKLFIIEENPIPQGRGRSVLWNKKGVAQRGEAPRVGVYDPEKSRDMKKIVHDTCKNIMKDEELFSGPLKVDYTFMIEKPKSKPKWKKLPDKKPDLSNYIKLIEDACNGVIWNDDGQICKSSEEKIYCRYKNSKEEVDGSPRIVFLVTELEEEK
jgi:Holliday junction resolvase RusA-like endonuclease